MPSQLLNPVVDIPRPIALLLGSTYLLLLALNLLVSLCFAGCLILRFLTNRGPLSPCFLAARTSPVGRRYGACEERADVGFEDDTDEEYMRRPY